MLGGELLDPIHGEEQLEVDRFLRPEAAVVVEGGDALGFGNEIGTGGIGYPGYELEDLLLDITVLPGR